MNKLRELFRRLLIYIFTLFIFTLLYLYIGYDSEDWNGIVPDKDKTLVDKFFTRFYFTTLSLSTIGYGDITPKTNRLRSLTIIFAIIMILEFYAFIFEIKWHTKK